MTLGISYYAWKNTTNPVIVSLGRPEALSKGTLFMMVVHQFGMTLLNSVKGIPHLFFNASSYKKNWNLAKIYLSFTALCLRAIFSLDKAKEMLRELEVNSNIVELYALLTNNKDVNIINIDVEASEVSTASKQILENLIKIPVNFTKKQWRALYQSFDKVLKSQNDNLLLNAIVI